MPFWMGGAGDEFRGTDRREYPVASIRDGQALEAILHQSHVVHDTLAQVVAENFGLHPVMTTDELLTALEQELFKTRMAYYADVRAARAEERAAILAWHDSDATCGLTRPDISRALRNGEDREPRRE